jgi:hypothetical protein
MCVSQDLSVSCMSASQVVYWLFVQSPLKIETIIFSETLGFTT